MSSFWIWAALLTAGALALLLPPLLRRERESVPPGGGGIEAAAPGADAARSNIELLREELSELDTELARGGIDEAQHGIARAEIERRVLDEAEGALPAGAPASAGASPHAAFAAAAAAPAARAWKTALALALAVPAGAVGLYAYLGNMALLGAAATAGAAAPDAAPKVTEKDVEAMIAKLAQRMEAQPGDPEGWIMLGRSYAALQRFPEATQAYARAVTLKPADAELLADYADVVAARDQTTRGEAQTLIDRALSLAPKNPKALALAGAAAFERKDFPAAINFWTQAHAVLPPESPFAQDIERSLGEARQAASRGGVAVAGAASGAVAAAPASTGAPAAGGAGAPAVATSGRVTGRVSLSAALASKAAPDDTVFIFARAAEGPRMPLAVQRRSARDLPFAFVLDDSMAMSPQMKLSSFPAVVVSARISRSGNAEPQPGDLFVQSAPLAPGSETVNLVIDQIQK